MDEAELAAHLECQMRTYTVIKMSVITQQMVEIVADKVPATEAAEIVAEGNKINRLLRRNSWYMRMWCEKYGKTTHAAVNESCLVYCIK